MINVYLSVRFVLGYFTSCTSGRDPPAPPVQCGLKLIPVEALPRVYSKPHKGSTISQLDIQFLNNGIWLYTLVLPEGGVPDTCCVLVCLFQAIMETLEREEYASPTRY